jgi:hypothetical protein
MAHPVIRQAASFLKWLCPALNRPAVPQVYERQVYPTYFSQRAPLAISEGEPTGSAAEQDCKCPSVTSPAQPASQPADRKCG